MSGAITRRIPGEIFSVTTLQAGGVFSGGLIAAFLAAWWYVRRHHMPALEHAMRLRRGWRLATPLAAWDALPRVAVTEKRRIISGGGYSAIRWRIRYGNSAERAAGADAII